MIYRILAASLCTMAMVAPCVADDAAPKKTERKVLKVGEKPESVCRGFGDKLYVTMINGEVAGDGTIVEVDGDTVKVFATGLNSPKGLVFVGGFLVAADETTLWKIDSTGKTSKLAEAKDFPKPIEFLNDVAAARDGKSVYVSEMSTPTPMFDPAGDRKLWDLDSPQAKELPTKGCVYQVTLEGKVSEAVPAGGPELRFPNGVAIGGPKDGPDQVFVGDFFSGDLLTYTNGKFRTVGTGMRGIDGIALAKDWIYTSSWTQGKVWKVDRKTKTATVIAEGFQSAADFFYDRKHQQLIVPDMLAGTLTFIPVE